MPAFFSTAGIQQFRADWAKGFYGVVPKEGYQKRASKPATVTDLSRRIALPN